MTQPQPQPQPPGRLSIDQAAVLMADALRGPAPGTEPRPRVPAGYGQANRWLLAGLDAVTRAAAHSPLELAHTLMEPRRRADAALVLVLDERWFALLCGAVAFRLRELDLAPDAVPGWVTRTAPLETLWFPPVGTVTSHRAAITIDTTPPELRRLGVLVPAAALSIGTANNANNGTAAAEGATR